MLKSKELLDKLQIEFSKVQSNRKIKSELEIYLKKTYNFQAIDYMQYIIGAKEIETLEEHKAYWLIDGLNHIANTEKIDCEKYFSKLEIRKYAAMRFSFQGVEKYPFIIENVLEVEADQWITVVDVNVLKDLYDKQMIIYNPNTQRELRKVRKNGEEYYTINVNNKSVKEIKNLLLANEFIPNDLSFNLSIDNPDVEFDVQGDKIIITGGQFDIIDGYHRFKAVMEAKQEHSDFNYKFVMKIMNYDETKACTFIAQEDKRNKISVLYSKSLDSTHPANMIIDRINSSPNSLLKGLIGKEGTNIIDRASLFALVDYFYDVKKMGRSEVIKTANHMINIINNCIDNCPELLNNMSLYNLSILICGTTKSEDCIGLIIDAIKNGAKAKITTVNKRNMIMIEQLFAVKEDN